MPVIPNTIKHLAPISLRGADEVLFRWVKNAISDVRCVTFTTWRLVVDPESRTEWVRGWRGRRGPSGTSGLVTRARWFDCHERKPSRPR